MSTDDSVPKQDAANSQDANELQEPGVNQVYQFMMYGLSLPERALRATSAMVGGAIHESASLVVPQAFRDSRSYRMFVSQMLDFVSTDVGGVKSAGSGTPTQVEGFVAKKAVSNNAADGAKSRCANPASSLIATRLQIIEKRRAKKIESLTIRQRLIIQKYRGACFCSVAAF